MIDYRAARALDLSPYFLHQNKINCENYFSIEEEKRTQLLEVWIDEWKKDCIFHAPELYTEFSDDCDLVIDICLMIVT